MRGYYISEILMNTAYSGRRGFGFIREVHKRNDVYQADNAYAVRVEPTDFVGNRQVGSTDYWATVFVVEDN